jgi:hypothetical protein
MPYPLSTVASRDRRNTLPLRVRLCDGQETTEVLYGGRERGDLGSLAAWRRFEADRADVRQRSPLCAPSRSSMASWIVAFTFRIERSGSATELQQLPMPRSVRPRVRGHLSPVPAFLKGSPHAEPSAGAHGAPVDPQLKRYRFPVERANDLDLAATCVTLIM